MRGRYTILFVCMGLFFMQTAAAQRVVLTTSTGKFYELDVSTGLCTSKDMGIVCTSNNPPTGFSVALFKDTLYYNFSNGPLYRTVLGNPGSCVLMGASVTANALTVDKKGYLYWVEGNGGTYVYNPHLNQLRNLGVCPYTPAGDMIFFGDRLIMAAIPKGGIGYSLVEVNLTNPAQSTVIMETPGYAFFGLINVPAGCNLNKVYGIAQSLVGPGSDFIEIDLDNKKIVGKVCYINENVYDAASITESGNVQGVNIANITLNAECAAANKGSIAVTGVSASPGVTVNYALNNGTPNATGIFNNLNGGNYTITVKSSDGCSKDTLVTVPLSPRFQLNINTIPDTCGSGKGSATLQMTSANTNPVFTLNNTPPTTNPLFSKLLAGPQQLRITDQWQCYLDTSFTLLSIQPPMPVTSFNTKAANCGQSNGSLTVAFATGANIQGVRIDGGTLLTGQTIFNNLSAGNHQFQLVTSSCTYDSTFVVPNLVTETPAVNLVTQAPDCYDRSNGTVQIIASGSKGPYTYAFNNGSTGNTNYFTALAAATYPYTVRDAGGCLFQGNVTVPAYQVKPVTTQTTTTDVDCWQAGGGKLSLAISGTEAPYFFSILGKSAQSGATISGIPVGTYMAQIRNGNNCLIDSVSVILKAITIPGVVCDTVYVPTGFTPNQDGKNDVLRPFVNNLVTRFEFRIYNRYGELIFETSTPGKGWNGRWKGLDQPPGTYVWMLTYDMNNRKRVFKGTTVLLR